MYKQLLHYQPNEDVGLIQPVIVETSPDLKAADIEAWEHAVAAKHANALPVGHQWGMIDQNHTWFDASKLPVVPVDQGKPGALLTPEQVLLRERSSEMRSRFDIE